MKENFQKEESNQRQVVLWGLSPKSKEIRALLEKANIEVVAIVDAGNEAANDSAVLKRSTPKNWKARFKRILKDQLSVFHYKMGLKFNKTTDASVISPEEIPEGIPVVCSYYQNNIVEKPLIASCISFCKNTSRKFLHPAFVLNEIDFPVPLSPKIKIYGFPGSGNMLLQDFIISHSSHQGFSGAEQFYCELSYNYHSLLKEELEAAEQSALSSYAAKEKGDFDAIYSPINQVLARYILNNKNANSFVMLSNIPHPSFAWDIISSGHDVVTSESIRFYKSKGYKPVVIVRHPLETILSVINKIIGYEFDVNYQLSAYVAHYYAEYLKYIVENKENIFVISYEDIVREDNTVLRQLCGYIGLKVSDNEIENWKKSKLFVQLGRTAPDHFKGGGNEKWRSYFTKDSYRIFKSLRLPRMAKQMGYLIDERDFSDKKTNIIKTNEYFVAKDKETAEQYINEGLEEYCHPKQNLLLYFLPFWSSSVEYDWLITPEGRKLTYYAHGIQDARKYFMPPSSNFLLLVDSYFWGKKNINFVSSEVSFPSQIEVLGYQLYKGNRLNYAS